MGWVGRPPLLLLQMRGRGDDGDHVALPAPTLMRRHHMRAINCDRRLAEDGTPAFPRLHGVCLGMDDLLNVPTLSCHRYEHRCGMLLGCVGLPSLNDGNSLGNIPACQYAHDVFR